jgi:hypothetical protein
MKSRARSARRGSFVASPWWSRRAIQDIALSAVTQDLLDARLDEHPTRGPRLHGFLAWTSRKAHPAAHRRTPDPMFTGHLIAQKLAGAWSTGSSTTTGTRLPTRRPDSSPPVRPGALPDHRPYRRARGDQPQHGGAPSRDSPGPDAPAPGRIRTLHAEAMGRDTAGERWLFPGRFPGQHLSCGRLIRRLHMLGVRPRMANSSAPPNRPKASGSALVPRTSHGCPVRFGLAYDRLKKRAGRRLGVVPDVDDEPAWTTPRAKRRGIAAGARLIGRHGPRTP